MSYNEYTRRNEYHSISYLFVLKDIDERLYTITLDDKTQFKVTSKHTIYTSFDKKLFRYIKAENLTDKNYLMYSDGSVHKIVNIKSEELHDTVYNLEVNQTHNFYIGDQEILVHNTSRVRRMVTDSWK